MVTDAANETHADCLRMIVRAEMRMADEIDAGQARGDVPVRGQHASHVRGADMTDLGIDRQRVAEWRKTRDAGEEVVESYGGGVRFRSVVTCLAPGILSLFAIGRSIPNGLGS